MKIRISYDDMYRVLLLLNRKIEKIDLYKYINKMMSHKYDVFSFRSSRLINISKDDCEYLISCINEIVGVAKDLYTIIEYQGLLDRFTKQCNKVEAK